MKTATIVKIGVCCVLAIVLVGCNDYREPTSHFGTGRYYCYYRDVQNGHYYGSVNDEQAQAVRKARHECQNSMPNNLQWKYCKFEDCVFK